jgi:hypothetical protein
MMEDPSGVIWIASTSHGCDALDCRMDRPGKAGPMTATNGLAQSSIWSIPADKEGNYWAGSSSGGLHRLSPRQFVNIGQAQGLPDNVVRSVVEISPGHILAGTHGGGVAEIADGKVVSVRPAAPGTGGTYGWSLLKDSAGGSGSAPSTAASMWRKTASSVQVPMPPARSKRQLPDAGLARPHLGGNGAGLGFR